MTDHYYPEELAVVDDGAVPFAGALKNVKNNVDEDDRGHCFPSYYSYCMEQGRITFSGPESIIGRSVIIFKNPDEGAGTETDNPIACGTIGTDVYDMVNIDLKPADATK